MRKTLRQLTIGLVIGGPLAGIIACSGEEMTTPTTNVDMAATTAATSKIAFTSARGFTQQHLSDIYTMYPDGSGLTRLTGDICPSSDECSSDQPTWSPNGGRIAFSSYSRQRNNRDIFVMNRTGRNKRNLTSSPVPDLDPAWSPDGTTIAFTRDYRDIWLVRTDGTGARDFSMDVSADFEGIPAWSLDGTKLAWRREQSAPTQVAVKNADGSGRLVILPHSSYVFGGPNWSPRAMHVAYSGGDQDFTNIYISNPTAGWWKQLTTKALCPGASSCRSSWPKWSRDGKKVAFVVFSGSTSDIFVVNRDGTAIKRLTTAPGLDWSPTWSPDSQKIAFVSNRDGNSEIYVMNVDGTGQRNLTNNPAADDQPEWSQM
jgi:Tol biopolymer transport system component